MGSSTASRTRATVSRIPPTSSSRVSGTLREPGAAPAPPPTPPPPRRHTPGPTLTHALREALEEALLRIWNRGLPRRGLVVLDHGPARYRPAAPVAPGFVAVRVYPLGEAGQDLGHSIEV